MKTVTIVAICLCLFLRSVTDAFGAGREIISLNGEWEIDESVGKEPLKLEFKHSVPVPGLANLSKPPFKDVDLFDSMELIANRIRQGKLPESARVHTSGIPRQERNYFWYRKVFNAPRKRDVAILKINKAQFGTAVWLNGEKIGEHPGCFTAGYFDLSPAIKWNGKNELLIRIGAHPGMLPDTYPTGTDFEKLKWTPGIYDDVSIYFADNPIIEYVQVAPRLATSDILVQTKLKNYGNAGAFAVSQIVYDGDEIVGRAPDLVVFLKENEEKTILQTVLIDNPKLWTPETPHLYRLLTKTSGDSLYTRFGMREFRSDAKTGRFYLNGKVYYLRGSNITLHRFFEDPLCGDLPWNESWVRKLLIDIPRKMNWNSFRFCIGPVPDRWLDIADEAGLLIQNEFFVWTGAPSWDKNYSRKYDVQEMINQYGEWMRDNWNHPSVVIWDANNETLEPLFGEKIIPAVRGLDLSKRPWENSYNPPVQPDDPVEEHPYLFYSTAMSGTIKFRMTDLEKMDGDIPGSKRTNYVRLINEYGWLWLNRDGSPTLLTEKLYPLLLGDNATADQRFELNAYLLAGKTEFWRAHRKFAGVLHFVYLTCSYPGVYTSDHFVDIKNLKLNPYFEDYMSQAFKPLGVYINFFQPNLTPGESRDFEVYLINDYDFPISGDLKLILEIKDGKKLSETNQKFSIKPLDSAVLKLNLKVPNKSAYCILKAVAESKDSKISPTICRRWVKVEK
ncbi:MAG: glycoside hydrolase family 2 protein [Verrucomicrobiia bacterium]